MGWGGVLCEQTGHAFRRGSMWPMETYLLVVERIQEYISECFGHDSLQGRVKLELRSISM